MCAVPRIVAFCSSFGRVHRGCVLNTYDVLFLFTYSNHRHGLYNPLKTKKSENAFLSNALQFPKERCFLEGSQALPVCPSCKSNIRMKMDVEYWWNERDGRRPN